MCENVQCGCRETEYTYKLGACNGIVVVMHRISVIHT